MKNIVNSETKVEKYNEKKGCFQIKNGKYVSVFNLEANEVKVFDLKAVEFNQVVSGPEREVELVGAFSIKSYKKFAGRKKAKLEIKAVQNAVKANMPL